MKLSRIKKKWSQWWKARYIPWLLWGIPALLGMLAMLALYIYRTEWSTLTVHDRYATIKKTAMNQGDYKTARIACERVLELSRNDSYFAGRYAEHLFDLAVCLIYLNRAEDARHLISKVAPFDEADTALSYPPAHLYVAKNKWSTAKERTPEVMAQVERHLLRAATDSPEMAEAHQILGELYLSRMEWDNAKRHLLKAADQRGECFLLLALVSEGTNDPEGKRQWNGRAQQYFMQKLAAAEVEDPVIRMGLARTYLLAEDFGKAAETFLTGFKKSGEPGYTRALGAVYAAWVRARKQKGDATPGELLKLVSDGLGYDNENETLLMELVRLSELTGETGAEAGKAIRSMVTSGGSTGMLHFALGVAAMERNKEEEANNFAMVLAVGSKPDYPRALKIINQLLGRFPDLSAALDTRGRIHLKMMSYKEAVADLTKALPGLGPFAASAHEVLAEAYEALKLPELAAEHRNLAKAGGGAGSGAAVPAVPPVGPEKSGTPAGEAVPVPAGVGGTGR
jgi:tetratricopeptide (TPR) repeat protein